MSVRTPPIDNFTVSNCLVIDDLQLPRSAHFLWITEFPLFTDEGDHVTGAGAWSSSHHPFTAPMWEDLEKLQEGNYAEVRGQHYDLVLNGVEVAGGSVRIHDAEMQERIMREVLQVRGGRL